MPNHSHVLMQTRDVPMSRVLQSWKRFIAREANTILHREGRFWEREYWDTYMRNEFQAVKARNYRAESCPSRLDERSKGMDMEQRAFSRD